MTRRIKMLVGGTALVLGLYLAAYFVSVRTEVVMAMAGDLPVPAYWPSDASWIRAAFLPALLLDMAYFRPAHWEMNALACNATSKRAHNTVGHAALRRLVSRAHAILVGDFGEPSLVTDAAGQVWMGYPFEAVGTVTGADYIAKLSVALMETGEHGDTGLCFCGLLPVQILVDAEGRPLMDVLVHVPANHVIVSTNVLRIGNSIFQVWPTGEVRHDYSVASGNNLRYGAMAQDLVERLWPDELDRRQIKRHNHAAQVAPHKGIEPGR